MSNVLVLAGGVPHAHDFAATGAALAQVFRDEGHVVEVVDHPDAAASRLGDGIDALVVSALFWTMTGDAYDQWRGRWAYSPSSATREAIAGFVHGGGGLVANHTAPICFDDWPEWGDVVGGSWRWGISSHPPCGPVSAQVVGSHEVIAGVPHSFEIVDEVYGDMAIRDDVDVLVTARRTPDDDDQPVVWTHSFGEGRVVFDGFGHDPSSIVDVANATILTQALTWVTEGD
jgi:uncharacterized protein